MSRIDKEIEKERDRWIKDRIERIHKAKKYLALAEMELVDTVYPAYPDIGIINQHICDAVNALFARQGRIEEWKKVICQVTPRL